LVQGSGPFEFNSKARKSVVPGLTSKENNYMYKLFVGGLPFSMTDDELNDAFAAHGKVASAVIIKDRDSGRSKGFGFVEFENEEEGKAAEKALNNTELGGRTITVNQARQREERPRRDFNGGGGGGNRSW
jgi:cold-inducible RNA-binding protein